MAETQFLQTRSTPIIKFPHKSQEQEKKDHFVQPSLRQQNYVSKTLVQRHFPESHKCHKIFRQLKLVINVSNSCIDNMETIQHNQKILTPTPPLDQPIAGCNYRNKNAYPLKNNCLSSCIQNNANVNTS